MRKKFKITTKNDADDDDDVLSCFLIHDIIVVHYSRAHIKRVFLPHSSVCTIHIFFFFDAKISLAIFAYTQLNSTQLSTVCMDDENFLTITLDIMKIYFLSINKKLEHFQLTISLQYCIEIVTMSH